MSGLNSLSSENELGQSVNNNFIKLFNKYNFNYYSSIYSNSNNTVSSIASLINFEISSTKENRNKFVSFFNILSLCNEIQSCKTYYCKRNC